VQNPFNPSFGQRPEVFLGRDELIREFTGSLHEKYSPWRNVILTGIRGSGKTAIVSDIREMYEDSKEVITVSVTSMDGMLDEILSIIYDKSPGKNTKALKSITGIGILGNEISFDSSVPDPDFTANFRYQLTGLLDELKKKKIKVIFLIDEVQNVTDELRKFVTTYQHIFSEKYDVALLMTGLPDVIDDVLNDNVLTFLRRTNQVKLENIETSLVSFYYKKIFTEGNKKISNETAGEAANLTVGFAYLVQLLGYNLWKYSDSEISDAVFELAVTESKATLFQNVHRLIYRDLSAKDRLYLQAMIPDAGDSAAKDIRERMCVDTNTASTYRSRLIAAGLIRDTGRGIVRYALPFMRDFLDEMNG
jgi:tRNA uridine 5-carbamoylmethylation protein Kti12